MEASRKRARGAAAKGAAAAPPAIRRRLEAPAQTSDGGEGSGGGGGGVAADDAGPRSAQSQSLQQRSSAEEALARGRAAADDGADGAIEGGNVAGSASPLVNALRSDLERVRQLRPRALTREQSLDIVHLYKSLQLRKELLRASHPGRRVPAGNFQVEVRELLGYSSMVISRAYSEFNAGGELTEKRAPANRRAKDSRLADSAAVLASVRSFVAQARARRAVVAGKHVLEHLAAQGHIAVDRADRKSYASALRAVQRYLKTHGFKSGSHSSSSWREKDKLLALRARYLLRLEENYALPPERQLRLVYVDEFFPRGGFPGSAASASTPSGADASADAQTAPPLSPRSSQRFERTCFAVALVARDPRTLADAALSPEQEPHFLEATLRAFSPRLLRSDAYGDFARDAFISWFRDSLLTELRQPSLIVLDSAPMHTAKPAHLTPRAVAQLTLADLHKLADELKLSAPARATAPLLRSLINAHVAEHVEPEVATLARRAGHVALFCPPHHSDLQPLEFCWPQWDALVGSCVPAAAETRLRQWLSDSRQRSKQVAELLLQVRRAEEGMLSQPDEGPSAEEQPRAVAGGDAGDKRRADAWDDSDGEGHGDALSDAESSDLSEDADASQ
jgi:hypothetical protein